MTRRLGALTLNFSLLLSSSFVRGADSTTPRTFLAVGKHADAVYRAMTILAEMFRSADGRGCSSYFEERGWNVSRSFSKETTLVIFTDVPLPDTPSDVFAAIGKNEPWNVIYLNPKRLTESAWSRLEDCELASLLLHELGHLARRDTSDNEPNDFFRQCDVRCLDPGKWH